MSSRASAPHSQEPADVALDDVDRALLNAVQAGLPLVERPFTALGGRLDLPEAAVLLRVRRLRCGGAIRQISAIFDTASVGYRSTLVAARYPAERLADAAATISSHPGVTHNYERNHAFNLWYTVAVPPTSDLDATVRWLHDLSGAEATRMLPALRVFKIGVSFDVASEHALDARSTAPRTRAAPADAPALTARDIAVVRALQDDIPIVARPFASLAPRAGCSERELLVRIAALIERGVCRRFAAILRHRRVGFTANAMGVWAVAPERAAEVGAEVGAVMATFRSVSHCYERPTFPDWPYRLFTMVHGRSEEECGATLAAIARATGIAEYRALYSQREFKKTRLRFFNGATEAWEAQYLAGPATRA